MAGVFHQVQLPQQSSCCNLKDGANACWQRSVKRKYNDLSLDGLQGSYSGNTGIWKGSCSSEVAQGTITSKGYCNPRELSMLKTDTNTDAVLDKSSQQFNVSELQLPTSYPSKLFLQEDDEDFRLSSSTLDMHITLTDFEMPCMGKGNGRNAFSTKTATLATVPTDSQTSLRVDPVKESAIQNEVFLLREALKSERKSLCSLYIELEKERSASATAANEAMAMIARLQEEKAAVLMEACQYRRVYEEREAHNQDAIALLKDILLNKEDILLAFQDQMDAYRKMFLRMESEGLGEGRGQGNLLEDGMEKEGLLFLEGQGTISSPALEPTCGRGRGQNQIDKSLDSASEQIEGRRQFQLKNQDVSGDWSKHLVTDGVRMNISSYHDEITNGYDEKHVGDVAIQEWAMEEGIPNECMGRNHPLVESICWERQRFKEEESVCLASTNMQEQSLEEASVSILARVKRLEKQFEDLGKTQEDERLTLDAKAVRTEATGDFCQEKGASSSCNSDREALYNKRQWYLDQRNSSNLSSERLVKDWEKGNQREYSSLPKTVTETQVSETRKYGMNVYKTCSIPEKICLESGGDSGEGIHDVYEVHAETKDSFVHYSECAVKDYGECRNPVESLVPCTLHEPEKELCEGMAAMMNKLTALSGELEGCGTERDDELVKMNSLEVKDIHKSTAEKEVQQLKLRLQALEGERGFMKQAIESLRKENTDLKLLQDIAQQIRELKGDVKKTNQPKQALQQDQLSFLSFLKGIFPFTGVQGTINNEWSRFVCPFSKNSEISFSKQNLGGLFHLLEKPQSWRSSCVTRGLKVRLPAGETGRISEKHLVQLPALYC